jgi:adenylate cyclase
VAGTLTVAEVARRTGVAPSTLRRWARSGLIPGYDGRWTPAAAAHARIVARLRERGHTLEEIRRAGESGKLAFAYTEDLFAPGDGGVVSLEEAARELGLEPELIRRIWTAAGFSAEAAERLGEQDLRVLRYAAAVLEAGFPLVAFVQLIRVYGQALAQIADAEVRLFHLYVHEPLMRESVPGLQIAEEMRALARELLPLAAPVMDAMHQRFLAHFVEQDVVGHMEQDLDGGLDLGRLRVAIAFADLAGYTQLTEELGDEAAVDTVERFVDTIEQTLPDEARIVKTIGDGVMVVSSDAAALAEWAVGFQELMRDERPLPRIGLHAGAVVYRDGDYFGREVNLSARIVARAAGGEVLVTRDVVEAAAATGLVFRRIGEVRLKGFADATELFVAHMGVGDGALR